MTKCKSKKYSICRSKNYLKIEELFGDWGIVYKSIKYLICRSKKYLWIQELSAGKVWPAVWRSTWFGDWRTIYTLKNYLQIEKFSRNRRFIWSADRRIVCRLNKGLLHWLMEEWSSDKRSIWSSVRRSIYGSKNYLQAKVWSLDQKNILFADWRTICRLTNWKSKKYSICRLKEYLQMAELNADRKTICRLKNHLPIKELFADQRLIQLADWRTISRSNNYPQIDKLFADWLIFFTSNSNL